jgi:predicted transposase YbfD/YdcC
MEGLADCFEDLADPRTGNARRHDLVEIIVIALCTVLCGGQNAWDMALFAREKEEFLRQFLKLENGLPSHDTFSRVFRLLDPESFSACFQKFMGKFSAACQGVIAIDGKVLRRSFDKASGKSPLHMVSAWGCDQRLVLAQVATDAKSNEITAVPKLLSLLSLKGTIVTVDALNCQRAIAQQIIDQGGDYAFALKGNQGTMYDDVRVFLDDPLTMPTTRHSTTDADHGRIETRAIAISTEIDWLQERHQWPGLTAIGKITRVRETGDKTSTETAYYLFSAQITAERGGSVVRDHWGVENRLHWCLDVTMNEDSARNRMDNGPQNLAVLRHMALNVMRKEETKMSLRGKLKKAAWNNSYLVKLLALF